MDTSWQPVTGAAQRRRGRRLRAAWRHEQQSIAQALAAYTHHAAPRGQSMARAGGWVRDDVHGRVPGEPSPQEPGTQHFFLDDDSVPELGGSRPDRLVDVRPQERVTRRIVEQTVDIVPVVQLLHVPVPQMVDSVVEVLKILDKSVPDVEQVIEVPKILQHVALQRSSLQEPQLAKQLVEVPTPVPCFPSCAADGAPAGGSAADRDSACWFLRGFRWVRVAAALGAHGGLLVESGLLSHPVGPPTGVHRQARAVWKYWPGLTWTSL